MCPPRVHMLDADVTDDINTSYTTGVSFWSVRHESDTHTLMYVGSDDNVGSI